MIHDIERVWIVYTGDYEQRGTIGPAFLRKEDADIFAVGLDSDDIEEFIVHADAPVKMTHYECQGWLDDVKNTVHVPNAKQSGFRLYEHSWPSWDVLTPELNIRTAPWSSKDQWHNFVEADGRNKQAVRNACVSALRRLRANRMSLSLEDSDKAGEEHNVP